MDDVGFKDCLRRLSVEDIRGCAARLRRDRESLADQVTQWRAELAIGRILQRQCTRTEAQRAIAAAHRAARLVIEVARSQDVTLPDRDVSLVARTAGQIASGLALGRPAAPFVLPLLVPFGPVLTGASPLLSAA